jgi:twinkle protein
MHGFQKEDLIVFTGDSGVGKTTFVNNMVIDNLYRGTPILGFYLEGQFNYYLSRMLGAHHDKLITDLAQSPEWNDIKGRAAELPLYLYSGSQGGLTIERMVEVVTACVQLYDIRVIMIDNLQRFVRGDQHYTRKVSDAVSALKDLATDLNITVVLIAHVRKGDRNQKVLTMQDLKDSSTIYQDADKVLILQKVKEEMYLTIEKNRMGEGDVNIAFNFDAEIGKFTEKNNAAVKSGDLGKTPRVKPTE